MLNVSDDFLIMLEYIIDGKAPMTECPSAALNILGNNILSGYTSLVALSIRVFRCKCFVDAVKLEQSVTT